jgi:branched-chain amino acid transport system ATP-binding protein
VALLECRDVAVTYGGLKALQPTTLQVDAGQLVGLIGPNGAGKTTLIDALTGVTPCEGRVTFDGRDLTGMRPHRRAMAGLGRTFQGLELFEDLSVLENLRVAADRTRWWSFLLDPIFPGRAGGDASVTSALQTVGIEKYADALPSELSNGVRKLVAVGRALASDPMMILLDEPAAGLDSDESKDLGTQLRGLVADGLGLLLVDHDMGLVLSVCDYIYVLDFGQLLAEGTPDAIRADDRVVAAYLGSEVPQ